MPRRCCLLPRRDDCSAKRGTTARDNARLPFRSREPCPSAPTTTTEQLTTNVTAPSSPGHAAAAVADRPPLQFASAHRNVARRRPDRTPPPRFAFRSSSFSRPRVSFAPARRQRSPAAAITARHWPPLPPFAPTTSPAVHRARAPVRRRPTAQFRRSRPVPRPRPVRRNRHRRHPERTPYVGRPPPCRATMRPK